jgi:hypothetical protein
MMLQEVLGAQDRNITRFGVDRAKLDQVQTEIKFMYARDLLQHGDKMDSARLAKANWRGSKSTFGLLAFVVRLLVPMSIINLKRRMK